MKFSVGYQLAQQGEECFPEIVRDYLDDIAEVYFPWADMASGRASLASRRGYTDWTAQHRQEQDLIELRKMGVKLALLFNANCYGEKAVSEHLHNQVVSLLEYMEDLVGGIDVVTTTSLAVAHVVKACFPNVEVRASVNMRLGTVQALEYVADLFDSYYVQRDYNRAPERLHELKTWADANNKRLCLLANSGCLRFCSGQTFHDNLVAHDKGIDETKNMKEFSPFVCWKLYRDRKNWSRILQGTWIRPEDLHHYEQWFSVAKLATRMHSHPRLVINAYTQRRYQGNLLDLFEPGFGPAFAPFIFQNSKLPEDWYEHSIKCSGLTDCPTCNNVLQTILTDSNAAVKL